MTMPTNSVVIDVEQAEELEVCSIPTILPTYSADIVEINENDVDDDNDGVYMGTDYLCSDRFDYADPIPAMYSIYDKPAVFTLIQSTERLSDILSQVYFGIRTYFPSAPLQLENYIDAEEDVSSLVCTIRVARKDASHARDLMDQFDEWWSTKQIQPCKLMVVLRYL